jgi:hypothetical protein
MLPSAPTLALLRYCNVRQTAGNLPETKEKPVHYFAKATVVQFILRPTVSRPVRLDIGLPFGAHDQILPISFLYWQLLCCSSYRTPSLTRGRVCNLQCNCWLVRSLRINNHTLPSHLRLCSLFVASYDSQGLRWKYSNPPPHGVSDSRIKLTNRCLFPRRHCLSEPIKTLPNLLGASYLERDEVITCPSSVILTFLHTLR